MNRPSTSIFQLNSPISPDDEPGDSLSSLGILLHSPLLQFSPGDVHVLVCPRTLCFHCLPKSTGSQLACLDFPQVKVATLLLTLTLGESGDYDLEDGALPGDTRLPQ